MPEFESSVWGMYGIVKKSNVILLDAEKLKTSQDDGAKPEIDELDRDILDDGMYSVGC